MKLIKGFKTAKAALARQGASSDVSGNDAAEQTVRQIISEVQSRGDAALHAFTEKFDGVKLKSLEVSKREIAAAYDEVTPRLLAALKTAARRIMSYHTAQKKALLRDGAKKGLGWKIHPFERVGVHVPGFSAPLPSSLLMTVIPAKATGVTEVIVMTPPARSGKVHPLTLVAADIAGADRIFSVGGAQAVAALAFGTESVPAVDMVCGPGNIYVVLAKKQLYGVVGIDSLAGPSEVMIIADSGANPAYCAADLLAQAEHHSGSAVLVTDSETLAMQVNVELEKQLKELSKPAEAKHALDERGLAAIVADMNEAVTLANLYAPEHLLLLTEDAESLLDGIRNAGCVILGSKGTVALGDYIAGPSHVLPTGGAARFSSPLNVTNFVKITSVIKVDDAALKRLGAAAQILANAEGLEAHAKAVRRRLM